MDVRTKSLNLNSIYKSNIEKAARTPEVTKFRKEEKWFFSRIFARNPRKISPIFTKKLNNFEYAREPKNKKSNAKKEIQTQINTIHQRNFANSKNGEKTE